MVQKDNKGLGTTRGEGSSPDAAKEPGSPNEKKIKMQETSIIGSPGEGGSFTGDGGILRGKGTIHLLFALTRGSLSSGVRISDQGKVNANQTCAGQGKNGSRRQKKKKKGHILFVGGELGKMLIRKLGSTGGKGKGNLSREGESKTRSLKKKKEKSAPTVEPS